MCRIFYTTMTTEPKSKPRYRILWITEYSSWYQGHYYKFEIVGHYLEKIE